MDEELRRGIDPHALSRPRYKRIAATIVIFCKNSGLETLPTRPHHDRLSTTPPRPAL